MSNGGLILSFKGVCIMNLEKKSNLWVKKNIISAAQREEILTHEHLKQPAFVYWSFLWIGVFCLLLGLISVVKAYWEDIPDVIKLSCLVVLFTMTICFVLWGIKKEQEKITEFALFFGFLMIGGGIGLIAQIFNLPVESEDGLFLWAILSFGIVLISKRKWLSFLWIPLFLGGIVGYMKLELLLLFFEQSPLFATTLICGIFLCLIYLSHFFTTELAHSVYCWSVILYFPVLFLGDVSMKEPFGGFVASMFFLGLLVFFSIHARRTILFNITGFIVVLRILLFYFQSLPNLIGSGLGFILAGIIILLGVFFFNIQQKSSKIIKKQSQIKMKKIAN